MRRTMTTTTPEQLLADARWRRTHSAYTLWALFGLGFVSLLYTGIRAKRKDWSAWAVPYGILVIGAASISGGSPEDPDAPATLAGNVSTAVFGIAWVLSAVHVFWVRKDWLRWKAAAAGRPQWYEGYGASPASQPGADLGAIGLEDLTSDYLAPIRPGAGSSLPPPPPPPTAPLRQRPPPPAHTSAGVADESLPPQPIVRPLPGTEGSSDLVDLNTATLEELASLSGVGVATAHRFVEERNRRGGFASVDEAAVAVGAQPHVRSRLQEKAFVSDRQPPRRSGRAGRIVDI